jgi:hypothetical protein
MDRAIDAAPAEQRGIGGVDDGIDIQPGDVACDDLHALGYGHVVHILDVSYVFAGW